MNRDATDAGRAAVKLIGVRKSFGQHVVIADLSLAVRAG